MLRVTSPVENMTRVVKPVTPPLVTPNDHAELAGRFHLYVLGSLSDQQHALVVDIIVVVPMASFHLFILKHRIL
jgi:hypothetical protein